MIEEIIKDYLKSALEIPAIMELPESLPQKFVLIEKTGGSVENHIYSATIAVQSYAESLYEAAKLNERVKVAMDSITTLSDIGSCRLNSDYNFTNTSIKRYRYQAVFDLIY